MNAPTYQNSNNNYANFDVLLIIISFWHLSLISSLLVAFRELHF